MNRATLRIVRSSRTLASCCLAIAVAASAARGTVVSASEGFLWNEVYTRGKVQGPLHIWQRLPGTNTWIDTGIIVQSDASGNGYGWQWRPGSNSPFREDHDTVAGDIVGPDLTQARWNGGVLLPPIRPTHLIRGRTTSMTVQVANVQTHFDGLGQGHTSAAGFSAGSMVALRLNPFQATFTPGAVTVSWPGVTVTGATATSSAITFQIAASASPPIPGTITIGGARITPVGPVGSLIDVTLDLQGIVGLYRDGVRVDQKTAVFGASSSIIESLAIDAPPPPPANDTCGGAITLTMGITATGDNSGATDDIADTCASGGAANSHMGVWYSFVPPATVSYTANTCGSAMPDTVLGVYTSPDCVSFTQVACNDDAVTPCSGSSVTSRIGSMNLTAGVRYYVHVSSWGAAPVGGPFNLVVSSINALGSCCPGAFGAGGGSPCTFTDAAHCTGAFTAAGSCNPDPCNPTGACCQGGSCTVTTAANCPTQPGQTFRGVGTACSPTTVCCAADFNQSGAVSVQDIFDFFTAYFEGNISADINGAGGVSVQDVFDFLSLYFTGC